jgi:ribosomal protein L18E
MYKSRRDKIWVSCVKILEALKKMKANKASICFSPISKYVGKANIVGVPKELLQEMPIMLTSSNISIMKKHNELRSTMLIKQQYSLKIISDP